MPNWCYNSMNIEGNDEVKDELYRQLTYDPYQHEKEGIVVLCGYPDTKDIDITMRQYHNLVKLAGDIDEPKKEVNLENVYPCMGKKDPYHERLTEWGTGREAFYFNGSPEKDHYTFDTAWSPADRAVDKIAEQYPELDIVYMYDECGMCFCGKKEYSDGKCNLDITEDDYDGNYAKAYIDIFDLEEYWKCPDCGEVFTYNDDENECYHCESRNLQLIRVGSKEDTLF